MIKRHRRGKYARALCKVNIVRFGHDILHWGDTHFSQVVSRLGRDNVSRSASCTLAADFRVDTYPVVTDLFQRWVDLVKQHEPTQLYAKDLDQECIAYQGIKQYCEDKSIDFNGIIINDIRMSDTDTMDITFTPPKTVTEIAVDFKI